MAKAEHLEHRDVALLIGQATMQWNEVHSYFFLTFMDCTGLDADMARAIFYSIPSDRAQRALALVAVSELAGAGSPEAKGFQLIVKAAEAVAGKRNAAVHQLWEQDPKSWAVRPNHSLHLHKAFKGGHIKVLKELDGDIGRIYVDYLEWNKSSYPILNERFKERRERNNFSE
ncbi:hypothetical protein IWC96_08550 [Brevundimonas sp. BAL450]|uniref:hypothetical protein n=1 Tax=Brevundimonas sp. BAL450 TaxID=1708162 RepID=UPI0018CBECA6|nr:hypothetical protein [Brevundimonas sp. BAL450]MBG7615331.1 hypothetical protein [Brevundimonas sp. BAL450]